MTDNVRTRLLIVEDDHALRSLLLEELEEAGHEVEALATAEAAEGRLMHQRFDLVISDVRLPGRDGLELLQRLRGSDGETGFIVITAFGSIEEAVEALKAGADDFLAKPLDLDHLSLAVGRALEQRRLRRRVSEFEALLGADAFHGMIGRTSIMRQLFESVTRIARGDAPVLITGESGTGKELVARALHAESRRADGPFIAVNGAGVPADLMESEFFGHSRGAFTGADRAREGLLQAADGGTLFLDEIGEMPVALQAKLLRVLEDGRIRSVGADVEQRVNVRIVAATNRDLERSVTTGAFRADLFYRLEAFRIEIPPLRARGEDIELLAARLLARAAHRLQRPVPQLEPGVLDALKRYDFPGNVRELGNAMERAILFCHGDRLALTDLPERIAAPSKRPRLPSGLSGDDDLPPLEEIERRYITRVLAHVDGNKRRAAAILGIGRRTLYRRLDSGHDHDDDNPPNTQKRF